MRLSPPITILAILATGVAGIMWLAPSPREPAKINVMLSAATYDQLALQGTQHIGTDGQSLTVVQVIEKLANKLGIEDESPGKCGEAAPKVGATLIRLKHL